MIRNKNILLIAETILTLTLVVLSMYYVTKHVAVLSEAQEVSIPLVASVGQLEQQKTVMQQQLDLTAKKVMRRTELADEQVQAFISPSADAAIRALHVLETWVNVNERTQNMRVHTPLTTKQTTTSTYVYFKGDLHSSALHELESIIAISGLYTVYDALSADQRLVLLERTEAESPAAITEVEDFFAVPLIAFAVDAEGYISAVLRSFTGLQFSNILASIVQNSALQTAIDFASSQTAKELQELDLFPYTFMHVHRLSQVESTVKDWQSVEFTIILSLS
jgi:hypothetical protein